MSTHVGAGAGVGSADDERSRAGTDTAQPPSSVACGVTFGDGAAAATWRLAVELPIEINVNGEPIAVMLATPADVEDLALGFAFTEHVLHRGDSPAPLQHARVDVHVQLDGIVANLTVPPAQVNAQARAYRRLEGRTGCGLCGIESLAALRARPLLAGGSARAGPGTSPDDATLARAFVALSDAQVLNRETHSVHAAAWCSPDGTLLAVREDVGRHNALDKLVGAHLRGSVPPAPGFVVMTSRLSYELVYKAHALGASCLATISAPTALAVDTARLLKLELACLAGRRDSGELRIARFPAPR